MKTKTHTQTADASQNRVEEIPDSCLPPDDVLASLGFEKIPAQSKPELPTVEQIIHDAENRVIDLRGCSRLNARIYLGMNPPSIYWRNHAEQLAEALQGWRDWADGKRSWPIIETNVALRDYEKAKQ